jgi:hypothetical protein
MTTHTNSAFSFNSDPANPFLRAFQPKSPFSTPSDEVPADAPEGSYTYQLMPSGPAVPAEECEVAVAAVQVMIKWGTTVLHVAHLTPPKSFYVGEEQDKALKCDFFLPAEKLGATRMPLVLVGPDGAVDLVVPAGATGTITLPGQPARRVAEVVAASGAPCAELAGAHRVALPNGARADLDHNGVSFEIAAVNAGRTAARFAFSGETLPYTGLSLLLHAGLLAATALFVPAMAMADDDRMQDPQTYQYLQSLATEAERETEAKQDALTNDTTDRQQGGDVGQAAKGDSGSMGRQTSRDTNHRWGIEGQSPDRYLSRVEAMQQAQSFGMIGVLNSMAGGPLSPTAPWGADVAQGNDPKSAIGNMWGADIGEAGGAGGLGLSGIGEGGGGFGEGVGVGKIGTIGHDLTGGFGHSLGVVRGTHATHVPVVRVGATDVHGGRIPGEVIQRIVRQNYGRFRSCYESGLRGNPSLQGRVTVRFIIGHDGAVSSAQSGGSDLPDSGVVSCVTRAFYGLSFPQPDGGIVTVSYPIIFSPAN